MPMHGTTLMNRRYLLPFPQTERQRRDFCPVCRNFLVFSHAGSSFRPPSAPPPTWRGRELRRRQNPHPRRSYLPLLEEEALGSFKPCRHAAGRYRIDCQDLPDMSDESSIGLLRARQVSFFFFFSVPVAARRVSRRAGARARTHTAASRWLSVSAWR